VSTLVYRVPTGYLLLEAPPPTRILLSSAPPGSPAGLGQGRCPGVSAGLRNAALRQTNRPPRTSATSGTGAQGAPAASTAFGPELLRRLYTHRNYMRHEARCSVALILREFVLLCRTRWTLTPDSDYTLTLRLCFCPLHFAALYEVNRAAVKTDRWPMNSGSQSE